MLADTALTVERGREVIGLLHLESLCSLVGDFCLNLCIVSTQDVDDKKKKSRSWDPLVAASKVAPSSVRSRFPLQPSRFNRSC
jgi:hypothetical protein